MSKTNPNEAAFARPHSEDEFNEDQAFAQRGLTKREYMATKIMSGLCATENDVNPALCAAFALECADALIKALNEKEGSKND